MATPLIPDKLRDLLLNQTFASIEPDDRFLDDYRRSVKEYVSIENSVAVLSDLRLNRSYIYAGMFGGFFDLPLNGSIINSAFEENIFSKIHPDDLKERHTLENEYFRLQTKLAINERLKYSTYCRLRAHNLKGENIYITHRTIYPKSLADGSVWLALCIYAPSTDLTSGKGIDGKIMNSETGEVIRVDKYCPKNKNFISEREREILLLIFKGVQSKNIAHRLNISINTVHRHRQNIIKKT
ncbi:LuxR C-terminal-related transcriptional regulator [Pontibacter sp. 13R65]|uniref:LuxR C-terminal-related transcriptional regulator n=1 Tax=Pontibacter sp. 13R65 TaxID=3127458 RepID=UPI00301B7E18